MEHQLYELDEIKRFYKLYKDQFRFFAVPARSKKYHKWCLGFQCPVASGNLVNQDGDQVIIKSLDLFLKYLNNHFNVELFTVVVNP
ncbi:hypothetical protein [Acinetobacter puyangensis]|uniref:hypothetical protein n=1 Tax=Acinetobacter puyangensis TaxID=1096779 RepID=UPI003A4D8AD5